MAPGISSCISETAVLHSLLSDSATIPAPEHVTPFSVTTYPDTIVCIDEICLGY
jgi:hypothetical protein